MKRRGREKRVAASLFSKVLSRVIQTDRRAVSPFCDHDKESLLWEEASGIIDDLVGPVSFCCNIAILLKYSSLQKISKK